MMDLNIDKYRCAIQPTNIFDLLARPIIEQMIRGFFYRLKKGVSLLWSEYDASGRCWHIMHERLDPFVYTNPEDRQFYNEVCWEYRLRGDKHCLECDRCVAQQYVDGKRTGTEPYECWLGLDDLAFPLRIGDQVRAVLIAGQIVPDDEERLKKIERVIRDQVSAPYDEKLIDLLHEERRRQWGPDPQYDKTLTMGLKEFGGTIQQILTELYESRKEAATRELLQDCEEWLASGDLSDHSAWWANCQSLCEEFRNLVGLEAIQCFERPRNKYERRIPADETETTIAPRVVLSALTDGQLQQASEKTSQDLKDLVKSLDMPPNQLWLYVSYAPAGRRMLSTLVVLQGNLDKQHKALTQSFCQILAQRADFFTFVERQRAVDHKYRDTVAQVAHDFRTPLQLVVLDVQAACRDETVKQNEDLAKRLERCVRRACGAEKHVQRLLETPMKEPKSVDLALLVKEIMADMTPMAKAHPCELVRVGTWPKNLIVLGVEYQLRRAMSNLIENAIKYSYHGSWTGNHQKLHRVEASIREHGSNMICVRIRNYGIGMSEELLERIKAGETHIRGRVSDPGRERTGTGWGLAIAISALEDNNGWLEIRSEPADDDPRGPGQQYHRYLTIVEATLPITK